jgi:hypothetical protein
MPRRAYILIASLLLAACSQQPVIDDEMTSVEPGPLPADFSGSWQRNYARDDQLNAALAVAYDRLARSMPDQRMAGPGVSMKVGPSTNDWDALVALARLGELITRPDVLTIYQDDFEIRVDRKDDFSMLCAFHAGQAKPLHTPYGIETCGWDGDSLVSHLALPGGLTVTHRFTMAEDRQQLRVVTTLDSSTSRVPFTLRRFYTKFERPAPAMNCIETLSMKRVCSTGEIEF